MNRVFPNRIPRNRMSHSRAATVAANLVVAAAIFSLAACGSDGTDPAQGDPGDLTNVTHMLEPTDQMRQAAEQQCLDNPDQEVGYVKAVAPESGEMLAELEIDCGEVRAG